MLDPPYIHSPGKHQTDARYQNAATTKGMLWKDLRKELYIPGMKEAMRIVKEDGGQVWVKCKDQVQSGMQRWCHVELCHDAMALGLYPSRPVHPDRKVPHGGHSLVSSASCPQAS